MVDPAASSSGPDPPGPTYPGAPRPGEGSSQGLGIPNTGHLADPWWWTNLNWAIEIAAVRSVPLEDPVGPDEAAPEADADLRSHQLRHQREQREAAGHAATMARLRLAAARDYCTAAGYVLSLIATIVGLASLSGHAGTTVGSVPLDVPLIVGGPTIAVVLQWTGRKRRDGVKGRHRE